MRARTNSPLFIFLFWAELPTILGLVDQGFYGGSSTKSVGIVSRKVCHFRQDMCVRCAGELQKKGRDWCRIARAFQVVRSCTLQVATFVSPCVGNEEREHPLRQRLAECPGMRRDSLPGAHKSSRGSSRFGAQGGQENKRFQGGARVILP